MLAHDRGGPKRADRRSAHGRPGHPGLITIYVFLAAWLTAPAQAQPVPDRLPGPRLQVEPPPEETPRPDATQDPGWVLERSTDSRGDLSEALAAAQAGDPAACLARLEGLDSPRARRLAFAAHTALGNRARADALFHTLSWEDQGRTAARLAAWRGIEDGDALLVRRSLDSLAPHTSGEQAALAWADWHQGRSLQGTLPEIPAAGTAGQFVELARAYQSGLPPDRSGLPEPWVEVARAMEGERDLGARDVLLQAYDAALREEWDQSLAHANRLLALYPGSELRGQAHLLRGLGRLAEGNPELAREDWRRATNALSGEHQLQTGLMDAFLSAQEGRGEEARRRLEALRKSPVGRAQEPLVLFHLSRLARYQGREEAVVEWILLLEEAYGASPWHSRAVEDRRSQAWGLPVIELPIPPARAGSRVLPPREGPFGLLLFGDEVLPRTARAVEQVVQAPADPPEEVDIPRARPQTANRARVLAGGGSRDTRYVEWDWIKDDFDPVGFSLQGAVTHTREGSALPPSDRVHVESWVRQDRDYGRLRVDAGWDSRVEGDDVVRARGMFLGLGLDSSDPRETSGVRSARVRTVWGGLEAGSREWDYFRLETRAEGEHPAWLGRLQTDLRADLGVQSRNGVRYVPWLLDGGLFLPLESLGRVGIRAAGSESHFHVLPAAAIQAALPGHWTWSGSWEPQLAYPDPHRTFLRRGDWNVPDPDLAPTVTPVRLASTLSWESLRYAVAFSGAHFRSDRYRSWAAAVEGTWMETGLDHVRGYELTVEGSRRTLSGGLLRLELSHARIERFGRRVPFTPAWTGALELGVPHEAWYFAGVLHGVAGRRDPQGESYGDYLSLNLEATYHTPLGLAASLRLVNVANSPVRRWPDKPIFSRGIYAGLGYRFGS